MEKHYYGGDTKERELIDSASKDKETIVVLYHLPGNYQPYVTWMARKDNPKATFWGHYFDTLEDAQEDFEKRLGREDWRELLGRSRGRG